MKKWLMPGTAAAAVVLAVAIGGFALAGGFDSDDGPPSDVGQESADAACLAGSEDCDDNPGDGEGDALGVCAPREEGEGFEPCEDKVVDDGDTDEDGGDGFNTCLAGAEDCADGGGVAGMCVEDVPDCVDMISPDELDRIDEAGNGDDPVGQTGGCPDVPQECEDLAIEMAYATLEEMGGPGTGDIERVVAEYVEWPNACLGMEQPDVACAEVITPGFIVTIDTGDTIFEFHTDTAGNAVLAE